MPLLALVPDASPGVMSFLLVVAAVVLAAAYRAGIPKGKPVSRLYPHASRRAQYAGAGSRVLSALVMSRAAAQDDFALVLLGSALWFGPLVLFAVEQSRHGAHKRTAARGVLWHLAHLQAVARNGDLSDVACPECRAHELRIAASTYDAKELTGDGALWCASCLSGITLVDDMLPRSPEMRSPHDMPRYSERERAA